MKHVIISGLFVSLLLAPAVSRAQQAPAQGASLLADAAAAQQPANVPPAARQAQGDVEDAVRRFGVGVDGGVGFDPELIMVGAHATFAPIFRRGVAFRPGLEIGVGEVTTLLGINLDVLYTFPGTTRDTRWRPYLGAGPTFGLSHRGFTTEEADHVSTPTIDTSNRFDFSDTDFNGGMNFIAGARNSRGLSFELKATAWGVSNIRLMAGWNF